MFRASFRRVLYNGITSAFQADDRGSTPLTRSKFSASMHYVYVLKSSKDNHLYYGYTNDLKKRLEKHRQGKVFATKSRLPIELIYYEAYVHEADARERERYFKTGWGRNYIKKILLQTLKNKS